MKHNKAKHNKTRSAYNANIITQGKEEAGENTEGQKTNSNVRTTSFLPNSAGELVSSKTRKAGQRQCPCWALRGSLIWTFSVTSPRTSWLQAGPTHQCYLTSIPFDKKTLLPESQMCPLYGLHIETSTNLLCTPLSFESIILYEVDYTGKRQKNKMVSSPFSEILTSSQTSYFHLR